MKLVLFCIICRSSLEVKEMDLWPACHEFEPSTAEDPPRRGLMHVKSVETQTSSRWCGVEVRKRRVPAQMSSSSLDLGSKL
ncbi:hypothetical protein TNCV_1842881 [Trichonephila clavipes]|nr:hypothetical protein TNCV_1842881 [Trichonephila clavipes]